MQHSSLQQAVWPVGSARPIWIRAQTRCGSGDARIPLVAVPTFDPHRSLWSHGPVLGTSVRLGVLLTWCLIFTMAIPALSPSTLLADLQQLMRQHPREFISLVVGLEGSAWIHLILDGDPWPQEWSNKRQQ